MSNKLINNDLRLNYVLDKYKTKLENYKYIHYDEICNI